MRRRATVAIGSAVLLAGALLLARPRPASGPQNVLVIVWDTARADRMSLYGHDRPTTPALERLASESVVFDRATSPAMWTVPAHASLFTGLPVTVHGADADHRRLHERFVTLAEWLSGLGYDTYAWSANPNLKRGSMNLLQGFETVETSWEPPFGALSAKHVQAKRLPRDASTDVSLAWPGGPDPDEDRYHWSAAPVGRDAFGAWLHRRDSDRPFFAFLNFMEAHRPRLPAAWARRAVLDVDTFEAGLRTEVTETKKLAWMFGEPAWTEAELEAIRGVYDSSLRELDAVTADLVRGLDRRGLLDSTLVVVTSDHGEALGEHRLFDHVYGLYDELVHVPLLLRHPSLRPRRVAEPVSTGQLFATVAEVLDRPLPEGPVWRTGLLSGPDAVVSEYRAVRRERFPADVDVRTRFPLARAWIAGDRKLIRYDDGRTESFDLSRDPGELESLHDNPSLEEALSEWVALQPEFRTPGEVYVEEELEPLLRALGYAAE